MKLSGLIDFNPKRPLEKGAITPFIEMADLPEGERDVSRIGNRVFNGSGSKFKNGDTLFARITPCLENGKTAKVSGLPSNAVGHGSTEFIVMAAKDPGVDEDFVYYVARHPAFRAYAQGRMEGTSGRQRVSWQAIADYEIPGFSRLERSGIGNVLSSMDNLIANNRRVNQALEAMAHTLFRAWFVDFEPVRAKREGRWQRGQSLPGLPAHLYDLFPNRLVDSELGEVPEGWHVFAFGDVAQQGKGSVNPRNSPQHAFTHYSLPAFDSAQSPFIELGVAIKSNKTPVPDDSVLVSKLNPHIPRIWQVGKAGANAVCSTEFIVWTPRAPANSAFLYCLASSQEFSSAMRQLVTGTSNSHQRVMPEQMGDIRAFVASDRAIEALSEVVRILMEQVLQNRKLSRTLGQLRDTLIPRLISGGLRVGFADKVFGDVI